MHSRQSEMDGVCRRRTSEKINSRVSNFYNNNLLSGCIVVAIVIACIYSVSQFNEQHARTLNITQQDSSIFATTRMRIGSSFCCYVFEHSVVFLQRIFGASLIYNSRHCHHKACGLIKRANEAALEFIYATGFNNVSVIIANLFDLINIFGWMKSIYHEKFRSQSHQPTHNHRWNATHMHVCGFGKSVKWFCVWMQRYGKILCLAQRTNMRCKRDQYEFSQHQRPSIDGNYIRCCRLTLYEKFPMKTINNECSNGLFQIKILRSICSSSAMQFPAEEHSIRPTNLAQSLNWRWFRHSYQNNFAKQFDVQSNNRNKITLSWNKQKIWNLPNTPFCACKFHTNWIDIPFLCAAICNAIFNRIVRFGSLEIVISQRQCNEQSEYRIEYTGDIK